MTTSFPLRHWRTQARALTRSVSRTAVLSPLAAAWLAAPLCPVSAPTPEVTGLVAGATGYSDLTTSIPATTGPCTTELVENLTGQMPAIERC